MNSLYSNILIYRVSVLMAGVFLLLIFAVPRSLEAQPAPTINYQGKLTDDSGLAVADGAYNMRFWLLQNTSQATTSALWTESLTGVNQVQVTNGLFSVMLGSTSALASVDFNQVLYLGVEVGGTGAPAWDGEMSPRKPLGTVPAAFVAQTAADADALSGIASTSFLRSDQSDIMAATEASTLLTINQSGTGDILNLLDGGTEVFTVTDGGDVGIGTTTPADQLHVVSGGSGGLTLQSGSDQARLLFANNAQSNYSSLGYLDGGLSLSSAGNPFTGSHIFIEDGGNVGIGTTTPSYKLTIAGDAMLTGALYDNTYSAGTNGQILQTTGTGVNWVATSSLGFADSSDLANYLLNTGDTATGDYNFDSNTFVIDSVNNRVGVGTSTPRSDLHVVGQTLAGNDEATQLSYASVLDSDALGFAMFQDVSTDVGSNYYGSISNISVTADQTGGSAYGYGVSARTFVRDSGVAANIIGVDGGAVLFNNSTVTNAIGVNSAIAAIGGGTIENAYGVQVQDIQNTDTIDNLYGVYVGDVTAGTQTNTPYSFYASDAGSDNYFAGNVGIGGESSRDSTLYVEGPGGTGFRGVLHAVNTSSDPFTSVFNAMAPNLTDGQIAQFRVGRGFVNNQSMEFNFEYDTGGNSVASMGIYGNAQIIDFDYAGNVAIESDSRNARLTVQTEAFTDILNLLETGGTEVFTVEESGKVGIGDTNPDHLLTVAGNVGITGALFDSSNASGTNGQILQTTGTGVQWVATSSLGLSSQNLTLGLDNQVPFMNAGGDDFDYSSFFTYDGTTLGLATGVTPEDDRLISLVNTDTLDTDRTDSLLHITENLLATSAGGGSHTIASSTVYVTRNSGESSGSMSVSAPLAQLIDDCSFLADCSTSTADVLQLTQAFADNTGAVLNITSASTNGGLIFRANDDGTLADSTPTVIDSAGNVGIGTTTPSYKLTIAGDAMLTGALYDNAYSAGANGQILQTTGTGVQWVATSSLGIAAESPLLTENGSSTYLTDVTSTLVVGSTSRSVSADDSKLVVAGGDARVDAYLTSLDVYATTSLGVANMGLAVRDEFIFAGGMGDTFMVIDASDPENMQPVFSETSTDHYENISSVTLVGNYAILGTADGINTVDISNPYSPTVVATSSLASAGTSISRTQVVGTVLYASRYTTNSIFAFDISDPLNITQLDFAFTLGGFDLEVRGDTAFAAGLDVYSFDVSDPTNITARDTLSTPSVWSLSLQGNYLYGYASGQEIQVYDVSDPDNMALLATTSVPGSGINNTKIEALGDYLLLGSNDQFLVYDITNPVAPVLISSVDSDISLFVLQGDTIYALRNNNIETFKINVFTAASSRFGSSYVNQLLSESVDVNRDLSVRGGSTFGKSVLVQGNAAFNDGVTLASSTVSDTAGALYNLGGDLYFNGVQVTGAGSSDSLFTDGGAATYLTSLTDNLGIGTTTPSYKLTVAGDAMLTGALYDNTYSAGTNGQILQTTGSGVQWVATSSLGFADSSDLANYLLNTGDTATGDYNFDSGTLFVDSVNDRVGIGTSTPASKLDVWGDFRVGTGSTPTLFADVSSGQIILSSDGNSVSPQLTFEGDTDTGIGHGGNNRVDTMVSGAIAQYVTTQGIGFGFNAGGDGPSIRFGSGSAAAPVYRFDTSDNTGMYAPVFGELAFSASGTESLRIDEDGNIGIGTTTPNYKLSVAGDLGLTGALYDNAYSAGTNGMILQTTGTGVQWVATSSLGISSSLFTDGGATTYLTSLTDNLSIGTSTTAAELTVDGGVAVAGHMALGVDAVVQAGRALDIDETFTIDSSVRGISTEIERNVALTANRVDYGNYSEIILNDVTLNGNTYSAYGDYGEVETTDGSSVSNMYGQYGYARNNADLSGDLTTTMAGVFGLARNDLPNGTTTNLYGVRGLADNDGWAANVYGGHFEANNDSTTDTTITLEGVRGVADANRDGNVARGVSALVEIGSGATLSNAYGFYSNLTNTIGGTTTNYYGMYLNDVVEGNQENAYAFWTNEGDVILDGDGDGVAGGTDNGSDLFFGEGQDAAIWYDGTDLYIDTQKTGSGDLLIPNGDVGIGTTSPTRPLHVDGGTTDVVALFESDSSAILALYDGVGGTAMRNDGGDLIFRVNSLANGSGGNEAFRMASNTDVTITSDLFTINGNTAANTADIELNNGDALIALGYGSSGPHGIGFGDNGAEGAQLLYRTTTNQLVIESGNDFSDNPNILTIDVDDSSTVFAGDVTVSGTLRDSSASAGTSGQILQTTGSGTQWVATSSLGISSSLFTDGGANTYLTSLTDSLGIGTTTPNAKLTVAGDINIDDSSSGLSIEGVRILYSSTTNDSVALGELAGTSFDENTLYSVAIGYQAGENASSTSIENTYIGYQAGQDAEGSYNVFTGRHAGENSVGAGNNFIGAYAGADNTGSENHFIGFNAGRSSVGSFNAAMGNYALADSTGEQNNAFGFNAGRYAGSYNNYLGAYAGQNTTGDNNTFLGRFAGRYLDGSGSILLGSQAMQGGGSVAYSASNNVAIGHQAGMNATTSASNNVLLGYQVGTNLTSAANNILLGYRAADNLDSGTNNIVIGYDVDIQDSTQSNTLNIGNLLFGTGIDGTGTTLSTGNIGIGTTSPTSKLTVWGDLFVGTSSVPTLAADTASGVVAIGTTTTGYDTTDGLVVYNRDIRVTAGAPVGITAFTAVDPQDIEVRNGLAYVADGNGDIAIIDVSDPYNPVTLGSYDDVTNSSNNSRNVKVVGDYLYFSALTDGMSVFDVSDPTNPVRVSDRDDLWSFNVDVEGSYLYNAGPSEVTIYDASDPANLVQLSLIATGTQDVLVRDNILYNLSPSQLILFDVSDPTNPVYVSSVALDDIAGVEMAMSGQVISVASTGNTLELYDVSNIHNPRQLAVVDTGNNTQGVVMSGDYVYVQGDGNGLEVFDISSTTNPVLVGSANYGGATDAWGLDIEGNYLYVADGSEGLKVYDIGGIEAPAAQIGALLADRIDVEDLSVNQTVDILGGLNVSQSALVGGSLAITGNSSTTVATNAAQLSLGGSNLRDSYLSFNSRNSTTSTDVWSLGLDQSDDSFRISSSSELGTNDYFTILGSGNIGIGTTTPSYKLTVDGDLGLTGALYDNTYSAGTNGQILQTTGSGVQWVATSSLGISGGSSLFTDGGATTYLTSLSDGLAIGTSATSDKELLLSDEAGYSTLEMRNYSNTSFHQPNIRAMRARGTEGTPLAVQDGDEIFEFNVVPRGTSNYNTAATFQAFVDGTPSGNNTPGAWAFGTRDTSGTFAERMRLSADGNLGIGTSSPASRLSLQNDTLDGAGISGLSQYLTTTNSVDAAVQFGNYFELDASNTATTTVVGSIYRVADDTTFGNTVRGLEVQTNRGSNTQGENTALSGFARTFGVRGVTNGDAGGSFEPAGGFFETQGTTQGNAVRGYSSSITSASLLSLFQDTSDFTGTGLEMNFGNTTGDFSSSSSKYLDFQNAGTSVFTVSAFGTTTIGDGTTNNMAGLQIGYGGICVDNDGTCTASTTGRITAVETQTGNSDLAEMYFSDQDLEPGEIVALRDELSIRRATEDTGMPVLGVVSTKPGLTLGFDDQSTRAGETGYPLALSGRVPVRLSTENGLIRAGDSLMLSSIPGVAMKSDGTGTIVGIALEDFDDSRMYSDTYINQFGDDIAEPDYTPITTNTDPRINDGCYYGGGGAAGDEVCTPLATETVDEQVAEANELAAAESLEEALHDLRYIDSATQTAADGTVVSVGQIVMFVDRAQKMIAPDQFAVIDALMATSTLSEQVDEDEPESVFDRMYALADSFVAGVLSVFEIRADRVEVAEELCVDGVCVTADDLRQILDAANAEPEVQVVEVEVPAPVDEDESDSDQDTIEEEEPAAELPDSATTTASSTELDNTDVATSTESVEAEVVETASSTEPAADVTPEVSAEPIVEEMVEEVVEPVSEEVVEDVTDMSSDPYPAPEPAPAESDLTTANTETS